MILSNQQLAVIEEQGFLMLPALFSLDEVDVIRDGAADLLARRGPEVIPEDDDASIVKMVFGAHAYHDVFRRVAQHPRLLHPVEQVLGERVHLFQSRLNAKASFRSGGWPWHQDFNQWYRQDGMRTPCAVVAGIFLDDVNASNGPLLMIPGSHKRGHVVNPDDIEIPAPVVADAASESGIVPLMGPPGTLVLFDCLIIHGSAPNISPWPRRIFYLNFTPVSNRELKPFRERFHCDADVRALTALADDCLRERRATA